MIEYLVGGNKPKQRLTQNSAPILSILFFKKLLFLTKYFLLKI